MNLNMNLKQLLRIIMSSLDHLDENLAGHSTRLSYDIMNLLKHDPRFTYEEVCKITWTTLFHDIGMLEKTPISDLIRGESQKGFFHATYGSLFMKHFSPFPEYDIIVKYHHTPFSSLQTTFDEKLADAIALVSLLDKVDLHLTANKTILIKALSRTLYPEHIIEQIEQYLPKKSNASLQQMQDELIEYLQHMALTEQQKLDFLNILISSFDFRSRHTAVHCATVTVVSDYLSNVYELDSNTKHDIYVGALLHDIGKIGIPHHILESPGKLEEEEWKIMKSHVILTEKILKGQVSDSILHIATRHHETLDGYGYPYGLNATDLTLPQRIVAVADVVSALSQSRSYKAAFSLDKICEIIHEMAENGKLCPDVCHMFFVHKEAIHAKILETIAYRTKQYETITNEYHS